MEAGECSLINDEELDEILSSLALFQANTEGPPQQTAEQPHFAGEKSVKEEKEQPVGPAPLWQPLPISLIDPLFGCPITLPGVGASCRHWQPICLLLHHRYAATLGATRSYTCPLPSCGALISFDQQVTIFEELPAVQQGRGEDEDGAQALVVVVLEKQPRLVSVSLRPINNKEQQQQHQRSASRCPLPPSLSLGDIKVEEIFHPRDVNDDLTADPANLSPVFLARQRKQADMAAAAEQPLDHWRNLYCDLREQLKRARRRNLRAADQLARLREEHLALHTKLGQYVARLETSSQSKSRDSLLSTCAAASDPHFLRSTPGRQRPGGDGQQSVNKIVAESRKAARNKLAQLLATSKREKESRRVIGGEAASWDRCLLIPLWQIMIDALEIHFVKSA